MKKILLLDIENLQKTEKELLKYLSQYHSVYLVYAKSPVNFSLDGLMKLAPFVTNGKLNILKMPKIGKDAADFGLAFIAGQLSIQLKAKEYSFDVMSNDHSMQYVVDLLKASTFEATVIQEKSTLEGANNKISSKNSFVVKQSNSSNLENKDHDHTLIIQYCEYLSKLKHNKPAKKATLMNSMNAILKIKQPEQVNRLIHLLGTLHLVHLNQNVPQYCMKNINLWAKKNSELAIKSSVIPTQKKLHC